MSKKSLFALIVSSVLGAASAGFAGGDGKCSFDSECAGAGKCSSGKCRK